MERQRPTILIVDDDEPTQKLLQVLMQRYVVSIPNSNGLENQATKVGDPAPGSVPATV